MSGNVWEWCHDLYGNYSNAAQTNPTGPNTGYYHVYRGGGWSGEAVACRVSLRFDVMPSYWYYLIGTAFGSIVSPISGVVVAYCGA
ncbi:MAG: SUMF1/EgtB/PvdO family nonheme iron enzyme [Muribaculaceae bacterium]|nr:SUMF1/EgtB/PvdO family nonheme iron enzyme [Muribaculaceae bacterium]